jgi:flagellin-like protein
LAASPGGIISKMKMSRNRKALSPVVASVILIAATVAVSIAVAVWSGVLTFSFMNNEEQMQLGTPYGWSNGTTTVYLRVANPGGNTVNIVDVRVSGVDCPIFNGTNGLIIAPHATTILTITYSPQFLSSYFYTFIITTDRNNEFRTTGVVP